MALGAVLPADAGAVPPSLGARVFVDTSASMKGFAGTARALLAVHAEIDAAVAEQGLRTPARCTVGKEVRCQGAPPLAELGKATTYGEPESRLDRVLGRAPVPARIDPNDPPPPDLLDDARLTVLVTDGMQATRPGVAAGGGDECAQGADPTCVRSLLQKRIADRYGVWLVGVLLPFAGSHFAERPLIPAEFAEVKSHLGELKFDARNLGVKFEVGAAPTADKSGNAAFTYKGYKPLLLMVLTKDPVIGRAFVAALERKLAKAPIRPGRMQPDDTVHSVELAPLSPSPVRLGRLAVLPFGQQKNIPPEALAELRLEAQQEIATGLTAKLWCGARGKALMAVGYSTKAAPLPPYLRERVELAPGPAPERALAPPEILDGSRVRTGVNCTVLKAGHTELRLALRSRATLDEAAARRQWWGREGWSSEDTWRMPERLYGLEELVLGPLRDRARRVEEWGALRLHVYRD